MGTEWYVVDKHNNRSFELGKGRWDGLLKEDEKPLSVQEMEKRLNDAWAETTHRRSHQDPAWLRGIAIKLWAFCQVAGWKVELRNDCVNYDDEYVASGEERYRLVASRYVDEHLVEDPNAGEQSMAEVYAKVQLERE